MMKVMNLKHVLAVSDRQEKTNSLRLKDTYNQEQIQRNVTDCDIISNGAIRQNLILKGQKHG